MLNIAALKDAVLPVHGHGAGQIPDRGAAEALPQRQLSGHPTASDWRGWPQIWEKVASSLI